MNGEELPLNGATNQDPSRDEIAAVLGAAHLPHAPLAMPKQQLEHGKGQLFGRFLAMFGARKTRAQG